MMRPRLGCFIPVGCFGVGLGCLTYLTAAAAAAVLIRKAFR